MKRIQSMIAIVLCLAFPLRQAVAAVPDVHPVAMSVLGSKNLFPVKDSVKISYTQIQDDDIPALQPATVEALLGADDKEEILSLDSLEEGLQDDMLIPQHEGFGKRNRIFIGLSLLLALSLITALIAFLAGSGAGGGSGSSAGAGGGGGSASPVNGAPLTSGGPSDTGTPGTGDNNGLGDPNNPLVDPNNPNGNNNPNSNPGGDPNNPNGGSLFGPSGAPVDPLDLGDGDPKDPFQLYQGLQNLPYQAVPNNPEPATFLLMLMGLGLPFLRKRFSK